MDVSFIKIGMNLKERASFNLNDGFIEAYKSLPATKVYDDYRKVLSKKMIDEVDLINNINILTLFSVDCDESQIALKNLESSLNSNFN